ncbi:MAG: DUF5104 domain-containing protein [Candidatus Fimenecus sp.]
MKKTAYSVILLVLVLLFGSCTKTVQISDPVADMDNNLADARMEEIFNAIKKQDTYAIKSTFSKKALAETGNIDDDIDCLLSFIHGEVVSWEREESPIVFDSVEDGEKTKKTVTWYTIKTNEQNYLVFLVDYLTDTMNPENAGLYSLMIINEEYEEKLVGTVEEWEIPGISIPESIQSGDSSMIDEN